MGEPTRLEPIPRMRFGNGKLMASVLDWAYWHLARDTTRRVLQGR